MSPESCAEKSSAGVFNLLNPHTGTSNCENTEDTFLGGKKKIQETWRLNVTTSGAVKAAAHYSYWKIIQSVNLKQQKVICTGKCCRGDTGTAQNQVPAPWRMGSSKPTGLTHDAEGQWQNLTTSNSLKLVHIGTDTDNVFL